MGRRFLNSRVGITVAFIADLPTVRQKVIAGLLHLIKQSQRQMNSLCGSTQSVIAWLFLR